MKEDYDGAEPSASSIAAANLIRLGALLPGGAATSTTTTSQPDQAPAGEAPAGSGEPASTSGSSSSGSSRAEAWLAKADGVFTAMRERLERAPLAIPQVAAAAWLRTKVPLRQVSRVTHLPLAVLVSCGYSDSRGCQHHLAGIVCVHQCCMLCMCD
jgi:hypothetical protein